MTKVDTYMLSAPLPDNYTPMVFFYRSKMLLTVALLSVCHAAFGQSILSKRQRKDSLEQANYLLLYQFLNLSATDTVADIGTGPGYNLSRIAGYYPKVHFVAEDIDSSHCNRALFVKTAKIIDAKPDMNHITFQTGTETTTGLPTGAFSKVLVYDVMHEMTYKAAMLADIKRILKPGGSLLVGDILVYKPGKKAKTCSYPFLTEWELKEILTTNGFEIVREQSFTNDLKDRYVKLFEYRVR